eukprot:TRINITY_DN1827_c0_g1_i1.p1 TRINITY_DN1827_c0_g1~~TRINITY_DN1827_c0_g1_i1.p1  ORF type:complete len:272 (+),score=46.93 TRINITY_DN1827_c0_g1_i1:89-817(+)
MQLKHLEQMSDDGSEDAEMEARDMRFFVKRVTSCVIVLGVMFCFGYFGMKLQGGEREDEPPRFQCDASTGYIRYTDYGIRANVSGNYPVLQVEHYSGASRTDLWVNGGLNDSSAPKQPVTEHTRCSDGEFSITSPEAYFMKCLTLTQGNFLWSHPLPPDSVYCTLTYTHHPHPAFVSFTVLSHLPPVCNLTTPYPSQCIGTNVLFATSTVAVAHASNVEVHIEIPVYPVGPTNATAEFALII